MFIEKMKVFLFSHQIMPGGREGMAANHSGTGVSHHHFDFFTHVRSVTVHRALRAFRLFLFERTFLQTLSRVIEKPAALGAKRACPAVVITAVDAYHLPKSFDFSFHLRHHSYLP